MLEQEPAVHQVVLARRTPGVDIASLEDDIPQAALARGLAGEVQLRLIHVQAHHRARRPGQLQAHRTPAAAQVHASYPGPQARKP